MELADTGGGPATALSGMFPNYLGGHFCSGFALNTKCSVENPQEDIKSGCSHMHNCSNGSGLVVIAMKHTVDMPSASDWFGFVRHALQWRAHARCKVRLRI